MLKWMQKNQKILSRFLGLIFLLVTGAMMYWNMQTAAIESEKEAKKSYQRSYQSSNIIKRKNGPNLTSISSHVAKKNQAQTLLMIMFVLGILLFAYSFIAKKRSDD